ncbi:hypothetical protein JG688_00018704 [Phytophthora aleatoria]|uniref:non-specific serine/threonine protein kinase n=1 Tax=Phytophthora aleatoria TaxID=2496075 RepID=A0A8J5IVV0_9STRA|nr:hypothetical protein JG688_00018704 [Phytophthora aleatoria]
MRSGAIPDQVKELLNEEIDPAEEIGDLFGGIPTKKVIHVLVVVPEKMADNRPKPHDSSDQWMAEFLLKRIDLDSMPFVGSLESFVKQPLPVKIRAKEDWLDKWSLKHEVQEKMFEVDNAAPCMELKSLIFGKRVLRPLRSGQTESSFICAWDLVFRNVLELIFTRARIDRDSCSSSSTGTKRPDFLFILDDVCVFRGEEKSPDVNIKVAIEELRSKLVWTYGSVPYVFGYAASGYKIDLVALHPLNGVVTKTPIQTFNLELKEHQFEAVLAILNLSLLFPAIVEACPASGKDEFRVIKRASGAIVRLFPTFVEKVFPDTGCFDRLSQVYGAMDRAGVSNVDRLTELREQKRTAVFEPRGTMARPSNLLELFDALRDVLQALVALHRLGWIHRDIRWSNVIRQRGCGSWFLIDFVDAATSPQPSSSGQHLNKEEHAPEIFVENGVHTTAVDIWAIGYLIETSGVKWWDLADRSSFYRLLITKDPASRPSAEEALRDLVGLQEAANREQEAARELQQGDQSRSTRQSRTQSRKRTHP